MPRKSRIDAPGALHHIITRGIERNKIFQNDFDRDNFLIYLYSKPIITVADVQGLLVIGHKPANKLVKAFVDLEILKQMPDRQRNLLFYFEEYLTLFNVPEEG